MPGEVEFGCLVVDPGLPVQPSPPPAPSHQQGGVGVNESPGTWEHTYLEGMFVDSPEILRHVPPPLEDRYSYPLEVSLFLPVQVLSWYVPQQGLLEVLPELVHAGQDDFLPPHDAFIPSMDKWFAQTPALIPVVEPVLSDGWIYPWEPSHYTVPTFDWQSQQHALLPVAEPVLDQHQDVPEWLVRTLPPGTPSWQQESPMMAPPPHLLEEVSVVMPLVTLDDTTFPVTDKTVFKKVDSADQVYQRKSEG